MLSFCVGSYDLGNTISIYSGPFKMPGFFKYKFLHKPFGNGAIFFITILVCFVFNVQGEDPLLIFALLN